MCYQNFFFFYFTVISYSLRVLLTNVFLFFTTAFLYHVEKLRSIIEIALLSVDGVCPQINYWPLVVVVFFKCTVDWSAAFGVYVCLFSQGEEAAVQRWLPHVPESPRCHDSESRPQGCVPGYEPAPQPLLHLLLSQHLPHGGSAQRPQQHRGVH